MKNYLWQMTLSSPVIPLVSTTSQSGTQTNISFDRFYLQFCSLSRCKISNYTTNCLEISNTDIQQPSPWKLEDFRPGKCNGWGGCGTARISIAVLIAAVTHAAALARHSPSLPLPRCTPTVITTRLIVYNHFRVPSSDFCTVGKIQEVEFVWKHFLCF